MVKVTHQSVDDDLRGYGNIQTGLEELESSLADIVQLKTFGVKADGVTDDTAAIQTAIKYCLDNGKNLTGFQGTCKVTGTIYIPRNPTFAKQVILDFKGLTFNVNSGATLFESGEYNGTSWVSSMGAALDTKNSFGVTLTGFVINGGRYGIRLDSWNIGCVVRDITTFNCETALETNNCYYAEFHNIKTSYNTNPPYVGTRFIFGGQNNLMKFSRLVAVNSNIGYLFTGSLTACQLTNLSFEGSAIGVQFDSEVYNSVIEHSYMENISDVVVKCNSYVDNLTLRNNYVNFVGQPTMYFLSYAPLPLNNIVIESDNMFINQSDDSKIFKTKDNTVGYNNVTFKKKPKYTTTTNDLLVDNTLYSDQLIFNQELNLTRAKAKVVNKYAVGTYSGRFTGGFAGGVAGSTWVNNNNAVMTLDTKIVFSDTQRIYVNLKIAANVYNYIKGEFIGNVFYEFTSTGVTVSNALTITTVNGYQRITSGTLGGTITGVDGEVRLI